MIRYLLSRLLFALPIFLGVVTIVFVIVRVLPGDPAQVALGDYASQEAVQALRHRLALDKPVPVQYAAYLAGLVRGDLGKSLITGIPVREAIRLRLCPAGGAGDLRSFDDTLRHVVLPAATLGLVMAAAVARFTRSTVLNTLGQDFVRTARAKGLRTPTVIIRHTLRAALIPIVSLAGLWSIGLIGDSVTTEIVFARPGLGSLMVGAMLQRDYTALQSIMVIYTAFVVVINLATDVMYGFVDPRVRY